MSDLNPYESTMAEFTNGDWKRILHALQTYVIREEASLSTQNCGDREWTELGIYSALARDVEYYIISNKNDE